VLPCPIHQLGRRRALRRIRDRLKPPVTGSLGSYGTAAHCLRGASWQIPIVIAERRGTNNRELKRRGRKVPTCHLKNTLRKSYSGKRGVVSSPNVTQLQFPARCLSHSRCDENRTA